MKTARHLSPIIITFLLLAASLVPANAAAAFTTAAVDASRITAGESPSSSVLFIENTGQWDDDARFQVWGSGPGTTWLAQDAQWITVVEPAEEISEIDRLESMADPTRVAAMDTERASVNLRLSFVDANPAPAMEPFGAVDTSVSYFIGADPDAWQTGVPVWSGVRYVDLYPGLDLEVTAENGQVVRRLMAKDDAGVQSLADVRLRIEGAEGLALDGAVVRAATPLGDVAVPLLEVVQAGAESASAALGGESQIGAPEIDGDVVVAPFATAGAAATSAIAPVAGQTAVQSSPSSARYGTYLGAGASDEANDLVVDDDGAAYVVGNTASPDFPATLGPGYDVSYHGGIDDAFVVKLAADGCSLVYATFFGGDDWDAGRGIAIDAAGASYITGVTRSDDFPAASGPGYDTSFAGGAYYDAFVAKLAPDGRSLTYATFLGGADSDEGNGIAVDAGGSAYVTGETDSDDFAAASGPGYDTSYGDRGDAFLVKLTPDGRALAYATFFGGDGADRGEGVAVDALGTAYVTGYTDSDDFPAITGPGYDTQYHPGSAFVVKVNTTGLSLDYATFLGGACYDVGESIVVDHGGAAYIAGQTGSPDFPATSGPGYDTSYNGGDYDGFVVKLAPNGCSLAYATFLGGSEADCAVGIAVDIRGAASVTGSTTPNLPEVPLALTEDASVTRADINSFVIRLAPDGQSLADQIPLDGPDSVFTSAIASGTSGAIYVAGRINSSALPVTPVSGYDLTLNGNSDGFVIKLATGRSEYTFLPMLALND